MEETTKAEKKAARARKKRIKHIMKLVKVGAGLGIGLAVLLYLLSAFVFFKVENIDVTFTGITDGNSETLLDSGYYSSEEIVRVSGVDIGDSLVLISKYDIEESIERLLPYIGNVKVQRKYPSTLRLTVEDTSSVYALDAGGGYTLLNENFKVLETVEKIPFGSAKVVGIPVATAEIGTVIKFNDEANKTRIETISEAFAESEINNITKIDLSNIANVKVTIDGRFTLVIGTLTQLDKKISTATKTIQAEIANNPDVRIIIDLTDPDRSYVRDDFSPMEEVVSEVTTDAETESPEEPEEIPEEIPEAVG